MTHPRSGVLARVVALVALALPFTASPAVASPAPAALAAPTETELAPLDVAITDVTPAVWDYDTEVTVTATVTNAGTEPIEDAEARIGIDRGDAHTRSWVESWAEADDDGPVGLEILTEDVGTVEPGESVQVTFEFTRAQAGIGSWTAWGAHGISVRLEPAGSGEQDVVDRTFVVWSPEGSDDVAPVRVAFAAPVVGPAVSPDPTTALLDLNDALRDGGRLSTLVEATADQPVAWVADPWLVQQAASSDTDAANTWAQQVIAGAEGRDVFALPALDPDPAAFAHANRDIPRLEVTGPAAQWRNDLLWPAPAPDERTVATAAAASDVVVVTDALSPGPSAVATPNATTRIDADGQTATAVVADPALSEVMTRTTTLDARRGDARRIMAETATIAAERPADPTTVLVAFPRDWTPDVDRTAGALSALGDLPWAEIVTMQDVLDVSPTPGSRTRLEPTAVADGELSVADIDLLVRDRSAIADLSRIVDDPDALLADVDPALVAPSSIAGRADPAARDAAVTLAHGEAAALLEGVSVVESSDYNLIAESGDLRVNVQNDLPQDATVQVVLEPDDSALQADPVPLSVIPAGTVTPVPVPVTAVGSGDVNVTISVLAADGAVVADSSTFEVRVRADWAGVGLWAIGIILGGFLVGGIWRTVRRRRTPGGTSARVDGTEAAE